MTAATTWYDFIVSNSRLPPHAQRQLSASGLIVLPGPVAPANLQKLSYAYGRAVATADPADVHTGNRCLWVDYHHLSV